MSQPIAELPKSRVYTAGNGSVVVEAGLAHEDGYKIVVEWSEADEAWLARLSGLNAIVNPVFALADTREMALLQLCLALAATVDCIAEEPRA